MTVEFKFEFGQLVYPVIQTTFIGKADCELCKGNKAVKVDGSERYISCPDCYGKGTIEVYGKQDWKTSKSFRINKICFEFHNPNLKAYEDCRNWKYYMADISGTLYDENNLFPTNEEAIAECEKRNKELKP